MACPICAGRGLVCHSGWIFVKGCSISECAATAAYVGGRDSHLEVVECDVIDNGHSGIFVDGSNATILDSNISGNRLTGISVVNGGTAVLDKNDILGNHATPVEYNLSDDEDEGDDRLCKSSMHGAWCTCAMVMCNSN